MRSIRTRVTILVAVILLVTLGAVGLVFLYAARIEVNRFLLQEGTPSTLQTLEPIGARIERHGFDDFVEWSDGRDLPKFIAVVDGRVRATNDSNYEDGLVSDMPNGGYRIDLGGPVIALKLTPLVVRDPNGVEVFVLKLPDSDGPGHERRDLLVRPLQRWIAILVPVGALVGILLLVALVRRVTGPLEELTAAVRRMEEGDLSVRVDPGGQDEVAMLAEAFNSLAARLERVEELRRNMVSDVAHELRSPLTNIRCELESVQDGVRPLVPERIDSIHAEILALGALVDDLQDLALADAGQLKLAPTRFELLELVRRLIQRLDLAAAARSVSIRASGEAQEIAADEGRISQVLVNLLNNAVAHSPAGGEVAVNVSRQDDVVRVEVSDVGEGVAAEDAPRIFDRFFRADQSRARSSGGSGLGLAIAKTIVEAHGGRIGLQQGGSGATFWFELPV